jgi:hypothetical protein
MVMMTILLLLMLILFNLRIQDLNKLRIITNYMFYLKSVFMQMAMNSRYSVGCVSINIE